MRFKLVARDVLIDVMNRQGWTNRGLAEYVGCAPGTIDNLISGKTQSVNEARTARLICRALDVPADVIFTPPIPSVARQNGKRKSNKTRGRTPPASEERREAEGGGSAQTEPDVND
jgi:transcriptional regulator with XRE-family HTH domain